MSETHEVVTIDDNTITTTDVVEHDVDVFSGGAPTPASLQKIAAEAQMLDVVYAYAVKLSKTAMMPAHFYWYDVPKGSTEIRGAQAAADLSVAIMYGSEIGLSALASAQNVFTVGGRPSVYARTMVAQVRVWIDKNGTGAGPDGDDLWEVSADSGRVVWAGRRNGKVATSEWTIERAGAAGFTKNPKYQSQPLEMLRAKAMTEICRILFQDVLLGMAYSVEDLQLSDGSSVQVVRSATKQRGVGGLQSMLAERKAARELSSAAPVDQSGETVQVEQTPEPVPVAAEASTPPAPAPKDPAPAASTSKPKQKTATESQLGKVRQALTIECFNDPNAKEALEYMSQLVGRDVSAFADLSGSEADEIVKELTK